MTKEFDPARLDVRRFADEAAVLEGASALSQWPRLAAEGAGQGADTLVRWKAAGELRGASRLRAQPWLHLEAQAMLHMACQRCLQPVEVPVTLERSFRFAPDEATAAAEDDASEEDVLAESPAFDLQGLVEDELLMALPAVPRHDTCPQPLPLVSADADFEAAQAEKSNPFAVLGKLRLGGK